MSELVEMRFSVKNTGWRIEGSWIEAVATVATMIEAVASSRAALHIAGEAIGRRKRGLDAEIAISKAASQSAAVATWRLGFPAERASASAASQVGGLATMSWR